MVTATLRMYAVGFGDCFLLTVPRYGCRPWRMLVDCGVHALGVGDHSLATVVGDLITSCTDEPGPDEPGGPVIDLVVASHRHQDHIAGFTDARWVDVRVGEVWLPWCEDPADTEAQRLRTRLDAAARGLHQRFAVDSPEIAGMALNSLSNERAMTTLRDGFAGHPVRRFLSAATPVRTELTGLPDARVHLLGPSRSIEAIKAMDPPGLERWLELGLSAPAGSGADLRAEPFGPAYAIDDRDGYRARYPHLEASDELLDQAVLDPEDALAAASWLDRCLNNTSLVLVVEVEDVRIVFPGDAQWGVWREILADPDARAVLARATVYKVSHHGSHNGSPRSLVGEVLPAALTSVMSVRPMKRWTAIPKTELVAALQSPTRRLLRPDEEPPATVAAGDVRRHPDGLWTEIDLG